MILRKNAFNSYLLYYTKFALLTFLFFGVLIGQLVPTNDPLYYYLRQDFRSNHDLYYLIQPTPFSAVRINDERYPIANKDGFVRFIPSLKIYNNIPLSIVDIWYSGTWRSMSFLIEPMIVNSSYGETELGESYKRAGISGRYESALIQVRWNKNILSCGRSSVMWGQSFDSSIILSGNSPPFDYLSTYLDFGLFKLSLITGQLHSVIDTLGRFKRFIAGKKIIFVSKSGKSMFSFGDLVLYTGLNRSVEFQYLNPFVPYFFADLEKEIERYPPGGVDNDNTMIFFDGRYVVKPQNSIYFEFLIDDFQIDKKNRKSIVDALGLKIGTDGVLSLGSVQISYEVEYTRISGYTYITRGWYTNWEDRNFPLGYKYGPDCQSLYLLFDSWLTRETLIKVKFEYLEKGQLTLKSPYDPYDKVGNPFPTEKVHYYNYFSPSISRHSKYGIFEFGLDLDLNNIKRNIFYLNLRFVFGFGYKL